MKWIFLFILMVNLSGCMASPDGIETSNVEASSAAAIVALAMTPHQKNRNHIADKKQRQKCEAAKLELAVAKEHQQKKLISQYQDDVARLCLKNSD
ncbi:hypothetical protein [Thalassotalea sp. ND16A]|uniref:hypothetical protein n=1 Tax=Thalassotalea sp. ND16A TaxID=1535422 RepID=UPI00051A1C02|nr:hypothetical protein [Thalassotalea sp. ND16A]KGJ99171.1 hypothetical protein ND16A_3935 [Thalassotalea sp. ND16A]